MKRILFAVDSFFQLIEAVNLRMSVYLDDNADIAVYASTPNAEKICENLKKKHIFSNCYFLDTPLVRCGAKYSLKEKLPKYFIYAFTLMNPFGYVTNTLHLEDLFYDTFLFSGNGVLPEAIFNAIRKRNPNISCLRFEDSYISYTREYCKAKGRGRRLLESAMHRIFRGADINDYIKGYYFAVPELVQVEFHYPVIRAPKISRENKALINMLNAIFDFDSFQDSYEEKYIFFESGDAYFENNDEDVGFIKELSDAVGKESILIKRHPRCVKNRFESLGVHVSKSSSIPWELIQLNINMDDKVFVTTTSAAALSSEIYFGDKCKVILLFEGMKNPPHSINDVMRKYMRDFQNFFGEDKIYMPNDIAEFKRIIKEDI